MNRTRTTTFLIAIFLCLTTAAQTLQTREVRVDSTIMILNSMSVDDYLSLELPPLDTLYFNAYSMSNAVKYYDEEVNYYSAAVKTEKMKPLEWLRLVTSTSYGNTDIVGTLRTDASYPIWIQNSTRQRNFFFNVGVTLNIPLSDVFNTPNKVRQAKAKLRQTEHRRESELDNIKQQIISLYCEIIAGINSLKSAAERLVVAKAQYTFAETDFINNKITSEVLYRCKSYETAATQDYERLKRDINEALLSLEVISCTKIISPEIKKGQE
ncbi:MAG: TolC family protein [Candidatus Cryptobacteroides sp.]